MCRRNGPCPPRLPAVVCCSLCHYALWAVMCARDGPQAHDCAGPVWQECGSCDSVDGWGAWLYGQNLRFRRHHFFAMTDCKRSLKDIGGVYLQHVGLGFFLCFWPALRSRVRDDDRDVASLGGTEPRGSRPSCCKETKCSAIRGHSRLTTGFKMLWLVRSLHAAALLCGGCGPCHYLPRRNSEEVASQKMKNSAPFGFSGPDRHLQ